MVSRKCADDKNVCLIAIHYRLRNVRPSVRDDSDSNKIHEKENEEENQTAYAPEHQTH